ncbi:hypothetical protein SNEBB_008894 [Seison nebaliae]|nr:hypothetical protein SNEBB_008894 [Seison nebaliae]
MMWTTEEIISGTYTIMVPVLTVGLTLSNILTFISINHFQLTKTKSFKYKQISLLLHTIMLINCFFLLKLDIFRNENIIRLLCGKFYPFTIHLYLSSYVFNIIFWVNRLKILYQLNFWWETKYKNNVCMKILQIPLIQFFLVFSILSIPSYLHTHQVITFHGLLRCKTKHVISALMISMLAIFCTVNFIIISLLIHFKRTRFLMKPNLMSGNVSKLTIKKREKKRRFITRAMVLSGMLLFVETFLFTLYTVEQYIHHKSTAFLIISIIEEITLLGTRGLSLPILYNSSKTFRDGFRTLLS